MAEEQEHRTEEARNESASGSNQKQDIRDDQRRQHIRDDQRTILMKYWDGGLRTFGDPEKRNQISNACEETGLPVKTVKVWFNNRRRYHNEKVYPRNKPFPVRRASAYHIFKGDFMKQSGMKSPTQRRDALAQVPLAWAKLKSEDPDKVQEYVNIAKQRNVDHERILNKEVPPPQFTAAQRKAMAKKKTTEIGVACDNLEILTGYQSVFMMSHKTDGMLHTGSSVGAEYAKKKDEAEALAFHYSVGGDRCVETKLTRKKLVKSVIEVFNAKFKEVTGKNAVPYADIKETKSFKIEGLPASVIFKKPGSYGKQDLVNILEVKDKIKFVACIPQSGTPSPSGSLPQSQDSVPAMTADIAPTSSNKRPNACIPQSGTPSPSGSLPQSQDSVPAMTADIAPTSSNKRPNDGCTKQSLKKRNPKQSVKKRNPKQSLKKRKPTEVSNGEKTSACVILTKIDETFLRVNNPEDFQ